MTEKKQGKNTDAAEQRRLAEETARKTWTPEEEAAELFSPEETARLLHELRVHQIELEMQNEELRRAQVELDAARARYFDLYDFAPVGYVTLSEMGLILESNLAAATLLGTTRSALAGQRFSAFILKEDQDAHYLSRKRLFETGEPQAHTLRMIRKDGAIFWAYLQAGTAQDEDGAPLYRVVVSDISAHKQVEIALRESEERHRAMLHTAIDGFWVADARGHLLEVNEAYCRMSGYATDELLAMSIPDLEANETMDSTDAHFQKLIAQGEDRFESQHRRKDGTLFDVEVSAQYKPVDGGRFVAFLHDITERKRAADDHALLEAQFQQAKKMESVGRLAGGVAHDFNNMLAVILGYTEVALNQVGPSDPLRDDLEEIRKAATHSADLTRQLLAFARKQIVMPRVLDLNDTVAGMLKMLQRLIGENIEINWMPGADLWPVMMDPSQIDQIMANLCVNVRDAIADTGTLSIGTKNRTVDGDCRARHADVAPGEYVLLTVTDNGCGMEEEMLANIFEPFFTTKETGKGTGLGLATLDGIVKQNGGFIDVQSEAGRGTTFDIYLPRHTDRAGHVIVTDRAEEAPEGGLETILLAEDEPALLKVTATMLESLGYTVLAADTPGAALHLAGEHAGEIRLLLTDVVMPTMNGRDLAQNLRSLHPTVKCLFMSGYTADIIAHQGVLDEGMHFIQKPFAINELAVKVREAMGEG